MEVYDALAVYFDTVAASAERSAAYKGAAAPAPAMGSSPMPVLRGRTVAEDAAVRGGSFYRSKLGGHADEINQVIHRDTG